MNMSAQNLISSFDKLPKEEQQTVASEILKRTLILDFPALTDEALVQNAEALFLVLDHVEANGAHSKAR
jgi:hypothetical protein